MAQVSVRCVSSACGKKIDPSWHFCPYCGTDNRPPSDQDEVGPHTHEYLHQVGYCLLCGEAHDELPGYTGRSRINTATFFLCLSILLGLMILDIQLAHAGKPAIAKDWIQGWYDHQVRTGRRYSRSTTDLGFLLCVYSAIGAFFSLLISIRFFFKMKSVEDQPFWDYEDDKPWWRRRSWWR